MCQCGGRERERRLAPSVERERCDGRALDRRAQHSGRSSRTLAQCSSRRIARAPARQRPQLLAQQAAGRQRGDERPHLCCTRRPIRARRCRLYAARARLCAVGGAAPPAAAPAPLGRASRLLAAPFRARARVVDGTRKMAAAPGPLCRGNSASCRWTRRLVTSCRSGIWRSACAAGGPLVRGVFLPRCGFAGCLRASRRLCRGPFDRQTHSHSFDRSRGLHRAGTDQLSACVAFCRAAACPPPKKTRLLLASRGPRTRVDRAMRLNAKMIGGP